MSLAKNNANTVSRPKYSMRRIYKDKKLLLVQILNQFGRIEKCFFYDENKRLSNASIYDQNTGKEIKNITYKSDGKTISSIRDYDLTTQKLRKVIFYKQDGKNISSIVKHNEQGNAVECCLYCDDGEVIKMDI